MHRWSIHTLAALSLLLMVGSIVAWVRSASNYECLVRLEGDHCIMAGWHDGAFIVGTIGFGSGEDPVSWTWWSDDQWTNRTDLFFDDATTTIAAGLFEYHALESADNHPYLDYFTIVTVPIWLVTLLLSLGPLWWTLAYWRRSSGYRARRGLCVACGYDMRGSVGDCPECGFNLELGSGKTNM